MKRFWTDIQKYFAYALYGAKVDLKAEVANSYLNWVWWILEPFCEMIIFTVVFGVLFASSEQYFPVYIYSGLIMWNFFARTVTYSVGLVRRNKGIITKVYVPKFIFLLENMILNGVKLLISFSILLVMMFFYKVPFTLKIFYLAPVYVVYAIFTFGLSSILLHFGVFIDDLAYAISILLRFLFYISGVFYSIDKRFPAMQALFMKNCNPVATVMDMMHNALLYGMRPSFAKLGIWLVISLLLCIFGIRKIYKYENSYIKVI